MYNERLNFSCLQIRALANATIFACACGYVYQPADACVRAFVGACVRVRRFTDFFKSSPAKALRCNFFLDVIDRDGTSLTVRQPRAIDTVRNVRVLLLV